MSKYVLPKAAIIQSKTADTLSPRIIGMAKLPEVMPQGYRKTTQKEFEYHLEQIAKIEGLEVAKIKGTIPQDLKEKINKRTKDIKPEPIEVKADE